MVNDMLIVICIAEQKNFQATYYKIAAKVQAMFDTLQPTRTTLATALYIIISKYRILCTELLIELAGSTTPRIVIRLTIHSPRPLFSLSRTALHSGAPPILASSLNSLGLSPPLQRNYYTSLAARWLRLVSQPTFL